MSHALMFKKDFIFLIQHNLLWLVSWPALLWLVNRLEMSRPLAYHVQCAWTHANRSSSSTSWCHYVAEAKITWCRQVTFMPTLAVQPICIMTSVCVSFLYSYTAHSFISTVCCWEPRVVYRHANGVKKYVIFWQQSTMLQIDFAVAWQQKDMRKMPSA